MGLKSRGSVAGLKGRTTTRAGSGLRVKGLTVEKRGLRQGVLSVRGWRIDARFTNHFWFHCRIADTVHLANFRERE